MGERAAWCGVVEQNDSSRANESAWSGTCVVERKQPARRSTSNGLVGEIPLLTQAASNKRSLSLDPFGVRDWLRIYIY